MNMGDNLNFAILQHINDLCTNTNDEAQVEQLEIAAQCLSEAWGMEPDEPAHIEKYNPTKSTLAKLFQDAIPMELSDKLAKFIHDLSKKGFFDGVTVGSKEFDDRYNRAKAKFFQKYATSAGSALAPAPAAAEVMPETKEASNTLKLEGNQHLGAKNLPEALRCYTEAIALDPTNHIFFGNRAAVHTSMKNYGEAVADCDHALALDPSYVKAYSRIGLAYYHMGEYEQSVEKGYKKVPLTWGDQALKTHTHTQNSLRAPPPFPFPSILFESSP
jgi:tetratricopeptide (TPR) repeat protein